MGHGLDAAAALGALTEWMAREVGAAGGLDAVGCVVDTGRHFASYAVLPHARLAVLAGDGRFFCDTVAAGVAQPVRERVRVLLPGDRLALWAGGAPSLAAGEDAGTVRSVIADDGFPEAESAAARLVGPEAAAGCSARAAVIVDLTGPGRP
jgi:hypothetical protein